MIISGWSHSAHSRVTSTLAFKVHQILSSKSCTVIGLPPTIAGPSFALCEHNTNTRVISVPVGVARKAPRQGHPLPDHIQLLQDYWLVGGFGRHLLQTTR